MSHTNMSIHNVVSVKVNPSDKLETSNSYTTDIIMFDEDGGQVCISLFSEELLIHPRGEELLIHPRGDEFYTLKHRLQAYVDKNVDDEAGVDAATLIGELL